MPPCPSKDLAPHFITRVLGEGGGLLGGYYHQSVEWLSYKPISCPLQFPSSKPFPSKRTVENLLTSHGIIGA